MTWRTAALVCLAALVIASRLCHLHVLWIEEAYGMAAAREILAGSALYRDVWFDKPPLYALTHAIWFGEMGWALRLGGAAYVLAACGIAYRFAGELWGSGEGIAAACLLGFVLTFGIPSAVLALAPDLLMVLPHLAAVYFAWRGNGLAAGVAAGLAVLCNAKGVLVLASCLIFAPGQWLRLAAGFALPNLLALLVFDPAAYWQQVWAWGFRYSGDTFVRQPVREALVRTANWMGFHAALVAGAVVWVQRERDWRFVLWAAISLMGVFAGWRFFPRYYFVLLPVFILVAARALLLLKGWQRGLVLALLLIPAARFGPRYVQLAAGQAGNWSDLALMRDSRRAADLLAGATGSLLVWGYRPDVFIFSGKRAGTPYLDSQPLTGVLADRHLTDSQPTFADEAARHRQELVKTRPEFIVDGLGLLNPALAIHQFPDLRQWLSQYEELGRTEASVVYRLRTGPGRRAFGQER